MRTLPLLLLLASGILAQDECPEFIPPYTQVDFTSGSLTNHTNAGGSNTIVTANLLEGSYSADEGKTGKSFAGAFGPELYLKYSIKWSSDFDFARGMKIARVTAADAISQTNYFDYIIVLQSTTAADATTMTNNNQVLCQRNAGSTWDEFAWVPNREQWYELQFRWKVESSDGAGNGAFQMWIDGVEVASYTGNLGHSATGYHSTIESILFGGWYSNTGNNPNPTDVRWQMKDAFYSSTFIP